MSSLRPSRFGAQVSPFELASEFEKWNPRALYVPGYGDFLSIGEILSPAVSAGFAHAAGPGGFVRTTPTSFDVSYAFAPIGDSMRGSMVFAGHSLSAGTATQHTALSMARAAAGSAPIYRICASGSATPTGRMMFQIRNQAGAATNLIGARPIVLNAPMGVVTTCNGGSGRMSLYRDGNLEGVASAPAEDAMTRNRFSVGCFGRIGNELPWDGGINLAAIFADVLPSDVAIEVSRDWRVLLKGAAPSRLYFDVPAGIETITADGTPDAVSLTAPTGAAAVSVAASGALDTVTLTAPTGAAAVSVTAAGAVAPLSLSAPTGAAAVHVAAAGALDAVTLTAPTGTADTVSTVVAAGAVAPLSLSAPTGAAAVEVDAAGAIDAVSLTAPNGTASTVSTVVAAGAVAPLSLTAPTGAAAVDVAAAGAVDAVTLTAPNGTASTVTTVVAAGAVAPLSLTAPVGAADVAVAVAGLISEITLSAPNGNASTGATVTAAGVIAPLSLTPPTGAHAVSVAAFGDVRRLQLVPPTGSASDGSVSYLPRPGFIVGASIRRRFDA